jgi:hypothetical protein
MILTRLLILLSVSSIIVLADSNCSSKDCNDSTYMKQMEFIDIHLSDFDDMIIRVYSQNTDFKIPVDSFTVKNIVRVNNEGVIYDGDLEKAIKRGYYYDVYIPKQGHFRVTKINVEQEKCSNSIFSSDYSYSINGYYVNDFYYACSIIKIDGVYLK